MAKLLLRGGRVIDPANNIDDTLDVLIEAEQIAEIGKELAAGDARTIDCGGMIVTPGLVDLRAELREPGFEESETIATGARAAALGGFTTVVSMPNTAPALDTAPAVEYINEIARTQHRCKIRPAGAITKAREGKELADIGEMSERGVRIITDGTRSVADSKLMRRAMEYASTFGLIVASHCEDVSLTRKGTANEGLMTARLGFHVMPSVAEESIVYRDLRLSEYLGLPIHLYRLSSAESVRLIRDAKARGVQVTCSVGVHHLVLNEEIIAGFDTNYKMNPPLRREEDRRALIEALADGTIDAIVSDHQPHHNDYKDCEFDIASFGNSSLETCLSLVLSKLVAEGSLSWHRLVEVLSLTPGKILTGAQPGLTKGSVADLTIIDPEHEWTVDSREFASRGRNSAYNGWKLKGRAHGTVVNGGPTF